MWQSLIGPAFVSKRFQVYRRGLTAATSQAIDFPNIMGAGKRDLFVVADWTTNISSHGENIPQFGSLEIIAKNFKACYLFTTMHPT